jgi:hypothetical protein
MNGFVVLQDVIKMLEPQLKGGMSNMLSGIHRAKSLAVSVFTVDSVGSSSHPITIP